MNGTFCNLIQTDLIQARILKEKEDFSCVKFFLFFIKKRTCRIQTFIRLRKLNTFLSLISKWYLSKYFIEVGKDTIIGPYFYIPHPQCIIIANDVMIGKHVHIGQYVTIGGNFKKLRKTKNGIIKMPILRDNIVIAHGAVIAGPIIISEHCIVGANSVITMDIPSHSIVIGQNNILKKEIIVPDDCGSFESKMR